MTVLVGWWSSFASRRSRDGNLDDHAAAEQHSVAVPDAATPQLRECDFCGESTTPDSQRPGWTVVRSRGEPWWMCPECRRAAMARRGPQSCARSDFAIAAPWQAGPPQA
jgi:ribosomal protein L24E